MPTLISIAMLPNPQHRLEETPQNVLCLYPVGLGGGGCPSQEERDDACLHDNRWVGCSAVIYCVVLDKLLSLSGPPSRGQTRSEVLNLRSSDEH